MFAYYALAWLYQHGIISEKTAILIADRLYPTVE